MHHTLATTSKPIEPAVKPPALVAEAYRSAHKTTHRITMPIPFEDGKAQCSATAIGPHALLTAAHCDTGHIEIFIDGDKAPSIMLKEMRDGNDHTIFVLANKTFNDYAELEPLPLSLGDQVFIFGNPAGLKDFFRQGQYAGVDDRNEDTQDLMLFDLNGYFGDSGSAIFDGGSKIVGVTSFLVGSPAFKTMGALPLKFTPLQIAAAQSLTPTL